MCPNGVKYISAFHHCSNGGTPGFVLYKFVNVYFSSSVFVYKCVLICPGLVTPTRKPKIILFFCIFLSSDPCHESLIFCNVTPKCFSNPSGYTSLACWSSCKLTVWFLAQRVQFNKANACLSVVAPCYFSDSPDGNYFWARHCR